LSGQRRENNLGNLRNGKLRIIDDQVEKKGLWTTSYKERPKKPRSLRLKFVHNPLCLDI
jgi:hypothetical protein